MKLCIKTCVAMKFVDDVRKSLCCARLEVVRNIAIIGAYALTDKPCE